ncbi:MAG: PLP-dependent aminotransferase family protein [Gemmatimonadales bacterium]
MLKPRPADATATRWLADALRSEILCGSLGPGARLPSTRELSAQYQLSRGTVVNVFEQLRSEGYLVGSVGSGTRVSAILPDDLLRPFRDEPSAPPAPPARVFAKFSTRVSLFNAVSTRPMRAFRACQPALDLFPIDLWTQVASRRLRRATVADLLGTEPFGYLPLREAIADYLRTSRGVQCTAEQVAVVSGMQEALDLVTRLVLDPGDRVAVEEPTYNGAIRVFEAVGAKVVSIPTDDEGITVGGARWRNVKLAYVTPAHQYPLGMGMSLCRRLELLEWARLHGAMLFEDDYDAEYRYRGHPVPALQGLDRHGVVFFSGTFSKVLFPALRLGYLVVPEDLIDRVTMAKSVVTRHAPLLDQATVADFISEGHFGRHLRRMREVYAERLGTLLESGRQELAGLLDISDIEAGLQTVGYIVGAQTGLEVEQGALKHDVEVTSLSRFARGALPREGIQLGFAAVDVPEIRRGVTGLARVLGA